MAILHTEHTLLDKLTMITQSIKQLNEKKKSKQRISSRKIISNNINDKHFQTNLVTYTTKQRELQRNFTELIKIHQECTKSSKHTSLSKKINIEDIELVVI